MLTGVCISSVKMYGWLPSVESCLDGMSDDGRLALLIGLEKLKGCLAVRPPPIEYSELMDGERGGPITGDIGEPGFESPLLEDSFRGSETNEAPIDAASSSELSAGTDLMLDAWRRVGDPGGASAFELYRRELKESPDGPLCKPFTRCESKLRFGLMPNDKSL